MFFLMVVAGIILPNLAWSDEVKSEHCIRLKSVTVLDESIPKKTLSHLDSYIGSCIDGALLKSITHEVASFYLSEGYITTRPYLKQQNIQSGHVEISVMKGMVEAVVDSESGQPNGRTQTAFAGQTGRQLNLQDIETSLEMVNRVPSSDAKFEIKPGSKQGFSIINVKAKDGLPYHFKIGVSGQKTLADKNPYLTADFSADNLFGINDILTFRLNGSRVQEQYQGNKGQDLSYSFPIGSYLTEITLSDLSYRQGVEGVNNTYLSEGETKGARIKVSKTFLRNQKHKFNIAASIYHKDSKNYFSNELIDVSSYKTTLVQIDLTHTYLQSWGSLTSTYSYYQGTNWFGARDDNYRSSEIDANRQQKLLFVKHSLNLNLLYYPEDRSYQVTTMAHLQKTGDLLYNNDQLTVGSAYTVRGYSSPNLVGNNGGYIKNDISTTWFFNDYPSLMQSLSLFAGLDYGAVQCEVDNKSSCGTIYGSAVGLNTNGSALSMSFTWSRPLKKLNDNFVLDNLFRFDITWKIV